MTEKYYQKLGNAFLAHYARRLSDLISEQGTEVLQKLNLITPSSSISTMVFLSQNKQVSGATLANALGVSHQMATQRINALIKLSLIKRVASPTDKRTKNIVLTPQGEKEITMIKPFLKKMQRVFDDLIDELGSDLGEIIQKTEHLLHNKTLEQRFNDKKEP